MIAQSAAARPHPSLAGLVRGYTGTALTGATPGRHTGQPGLSLPLILTLRDHPVDFVDGEPLVSVTAGLRLAPVHIAHGASAHTVSVDLTPAGVRALFGVPAAELTGRVLAADAAFGAPVERLRQRVEEVEGWTDRFALVDAWLRARRPSEPTVDRLAAVAWSAIVADGGRRPVAAVAARLDCAPRTLHARLRRETGLGPKALSRLARFRAARELVHRRVAAGGPTPTLARIAADCGYSDESHLQRDWSAFAGVPPGRWRASDPVAFAAAE